ncbi:MAG TPA: hypothetical protein VKJ47_19140 [Candidatus Binatia bacterium]|nr:hypothetical protein [Candidatus Binatia bacterium]
MALFEDVLGGWGSSAAVGVGVVLAAPIVLPVVGTILRPVAKGLVKGYFFLADTVQDGAVQTREEVGELMSEAQSERARERPHFVSRHGARTRNGHKHGSRTQRRAKPAHAAKRSAAAARAA